MGPQRSGTLGTNAIVANVKFLQRGEACKVGPQRCGPLVTNVVETQIKFLRGREACKVGPQRSGTLSLNAVEAQIKVQQRGEVCKLGRQHCATLGTMSSCLISRCCNEARPARWGTNALATLAPMPILANRGPAPR